MSDDTSSPRSNVPRVTLTGTANYTEWYSEITSFLLGKRLLHVIRNANANDLPPLLESSLVQTTAKPEETKLRLDHEDTFSYII
jgi:hypothetical protein